MLFTGIATSCLLGCNKEEVQEVAEDTPVTVDTISAEKSTLVISETFMGSVSAQRELKVYPRTAGEVVKINVKAGDHVNAGDILFQLNDEFAQLDLESAKTNLSKTQAEVKKSQGSEEVLTQQKEWQALENQNSKIADSNYNLNTAKEDYNRQVAYLGEAREHESGAYDDYKKAEDKYGKAKDILHDYEKLQKEEPAFENYTLEEAATTDPAVSGATQAHVDRAKSLWSKATDKENGKLYAADVTPAGVASLRATRETLFEKYNSSKSAREAQEDKVTSAQRATDKAEKTLQDQYTSYRQDVDNMLVRDIALQEDNKRIQQIDINSSSINVEKAQQTLNQYTVTAPISGVIGKVGIKEFEMVATGTEAILIENTDSMNVEFSVTEEVRNNLKEGQSVTIEKDNDKIIGRVKEIAEVPDDVVVAHRRPDRLSVLVQEAHGAVLIIHRKVLLGHALHLAYVLLLLQLCSHFLCGHNGKLYSFPFCQPSTPASKPIGSWLSIITGSTPSCCRAPSIQKFHHSGSSRWLSSMRSSMMIKGLLREMI